MIRRDRGYDPFVERSGSRLARFIRRVLPWLSLGISIASVILMDRRPERAWLIAAAAGGGWIVLSLFGLAQGIDPERLRGRAAWLGRAARFSTAAGAQSLIQMCLFFSAPFYVRASVSPWHWGFVAVLVGASVLTSWDPWCQWVLRHRLWASLLQAFATFAALDCVLPLIGVSNRFALYVAAGAAVLGVPLAAGGSVLRRLLAMLLAAALAGGALWAGGARAIPPAPLRFVSGAIGTRIVDRELVDPTAELPSPPEQLVCATAIAAPRGLRDKLHHVWRQDGVKRGKLTLDIRGGRDKGFRAWSYRRNPGPGRWTCTVETESGQLLGGAQIILGNAPTTLPRLPDAATK